MMPRDPQRATGDRGEALARMHLESKGYALVTTNWSCKAGEIDLVMQDGFTRVFVEVRTRRPTQYGTGYETVSWQKQQKLRRAAQWYQQAEDWWGDARFDVVSIEWGEDERVRIDHIPHAFEVS